MRFVPVKEIRLLVDGEQAYPEMLAAIDNAQHTVDLETYILHDDATGRAFQLALCRAATRGVRVRLLYDWLGSFSLPPAYVRALVAAGVAVAAFHPLIVRRPVWAINKRDHRKILIVDACIAFTGGLNLTDSQVSVSGGGKGWRDTHVRLDGPKVACEMSVLFNYAWQRATPYYESLTRRAKLKWRMHRRLVTRMRTDDPHDALADSEGGTPVSIVGNELLRHRRRIHRAYIRAICAAQRYVIIENAYFIPNRGVRKALIRAVRRGVRVAIVVTDRSDVAIIAHAGRWTYEELLTGGVRIFEWPETMMHSKLAVIDDAWSIIGSYNLDHCSLLHNLECVAVIADQTFAEFLRDQTLVDIARCHEVSLETYRQRPWRKKAKEYLAYMLRRWL